ncbi:MAG: phosphoesterase PA-phosphatase related protein [Solirubrobacterales bacterium]|nr:phosphoesterase PA-phosphatase related protein [Solirubrobacterales bacterium]
MDYSLYKTINGLTGNAFFDGLFTFVAHDFPVILVALVALTFLVPFADRRRERRSGAVLATASAAIALLINQPISHLVARARPYVAHPDHAHLLIARSHDLSFPSDHATGAFALAFAVWLYDRTTGSVLLALAAILSFARVYTGTHYPADVLAGALIGIGIAALLRTIPHSRVLLEAVAARCGAAWDALTTRLAARAG